MQSLCFHYDVSLDCLCLEEVQARLLVLRDVLSGYHASQAHVAYPSCILVSLIREDFNAAVHILEGLIAEVLMR